MKKLLVTASTLGMLTIASQAYAVEGQWPKWYVGLTGGVGFLSDEDIRGTASGKASYESGFSGDIALGYMPTFGTGMWNNFRLEGELGYRSNSIDSIRLGGATTNSTGDLRDISYMGNIYYDFRNPSAWTPYIGAGAGVSSVRLSRSAIVGLTDKDDSVFSYQGMAGISYAPATLPNTEWNIGYRYFGTNDMHFNTGAGPIRLDRQADQSAEVGAKFRF